jgi:fumarate hydratase class II
MPFRTETDTLGEVQVSSDKYWGGANTTIVNEFPHWPCCVNAS